VVVCSIDALITGHHVRIRTSAGGIAEVISRDDD
jgi:hypothetical protein